MVHRNHLVAAIKVAGKVLREGPNNTVTIPFGAEYSVLIKNLNSRRIKFKLSIDGKDATEGTWLVVRPNSSLELERYIRSGNLTSGNRFKFIERTAAIEGHRGVQAEDGLIRIEWLTERATIEVPQIKYRDIDVPVPRPLRPYDPFDPYWDPWWPPRYPRPVFEKFSRIAEEPPDIKVSFGDRSVSLSKSAERFPSISAAVNRALSDVGITVPGSQSGQAFYPVQDFSTETSSEVLVINLRGQIDGIPVQKPVTVNYKPKCQTCGRQNQVNAQFCSQCGTALNIL